MSNCAAHKAGLHNHRMLDLLAACSYVKMRQYCQAMPARHLELLAGDAADHGLAAVVAVPRRLQLLPKLPDWVPLQTSTTYRDEMPKGFSCRVPRTALTQLLSHHPRRVQALLASACDA